MCFLSILFYEAQHNAQEIKGSYVGPSKCASLFCCSSLHASLIVKRKIVIKHSNHERMNVYLYTAYISHRLMAVYNSY